MQQSRRGLALFWPLFTLGCGGFEPRNFGETAPKHAAAGNAGYSYDAGTPEAGRAATAPPRQPTDDWGPPEASGGEGGAAQAGREPSTSPPQPGPSDAGATGDGGASAGYGGARAGAASTGGSSHDAGAGGRGAGAAAGRSGGGAAGTGGVAGGHGGAAPGGGTAGRAGGAGHGEHSSGGEGGEGNAKHALVLSEYVEGSGRYKALELRALETSVLDGCSIDYYASGASEAATFTLMGELEAGKTYVICTSSLAERLGASCNLMHNLVFNGDDALTLECDGVVLDSFGQIGLDPGTAWSGSGVSTVNQTLRRRCSVQHGDTVATDAFDPSLEWQSHPLDEFSGLGSPDCD